MKKLIITITFFLGFNENINPAWTAFKSRAAFYRLKHSGTILISTYYSFLFLSISTTFLYQNYKYKQSVQKAEQYTNQFYNSDQFKQFVKQYRCSAQDEQKIEDGDTSIGYLKLDFDRLENACKMKNVISLNNLDKLSVAEKCLCRLKNGQWRILSKKVIPENDDTKISLQEIKQLVQFGKETGFWDWGLNDLGKTDIKQWRNLIRSIDGKLVFIDCESRGFANGNCHEDMEYKFFPYWSTLKNIHRSPDCRGISDDALTLEALEWLKNEYKQEKNKKRRYDKNTQKHIVLPYSNKCKGDCATFDFENEKTKNYTFEALRLVAKRCVADKDFSAKKLYFFIYL